jgi:hypothetical protein
MHVVETFNDLRGFIPRRAPPAASRGRRAERAQDRAGHHDVERLDRIDCTVMSFGTLRGPIPASHIKFIEPK